MQRPAHRAGVRIQPARGVLALHKGRLEQAGVKFKIFKSCYVTGSSQSEQTRRPMRTDVGCKQTVWLWECIPGKCQSRQQRSPTWEKEHQQVLRCQQRTAHLSPKKVPERCPVDPQGSAEDGVKTTAVEERAKGFKAKCQAQEHHCLRDAQSQPPEEQSPKSTRRLAHEGSN